MENIIRAERLKLNHSFGNKLPIVAPIITLFITLLLTGGLQEAFPAGAWNWWYIILLPGMLAILCYLDIQKDKKLNFHNILSSHLPGGKVWMGKVIYCSFGLQLSNLIVFLGTLIGGAGFGTTITPLGGLISAALLSITYLWEIPLFLFLSAKFGMFASVFSCMVLSIGGTMTLADKTIWWVCPSSIPIRLMCPTLQRLPNGLPVPAGSELLSTSVILPGVLISLIWFLLLAVLTTRWFDRLEV